MLKYKGCCVHHAAEWVVVVSESTQRCLPPRPLTSVEEGYLGKVSEAEAFPNPWCCPYAILKEEKKKRKKKTKEVKKRKIVGPHLFLP